MLLLNQGLPQFNLFNVNLVESTIGSLLDNQHKKFLELENELILNENTNDIDKLYNLAVYEDEKFSHC